MEGTRVGYARCSTDEQDVEVQIEQLTALGVDTDRIYIDRIYIDRGFSGTRRDNRAGLDQALAAAWDGTIFTVTKFDRFARNMAEAHTILTDLSNRGVRFALGASVYDWNDPFGRLFLQTLAMVAEFEANLGHLRTREGMAIAKRKGKLRGKQPKLPPSAQRSIHRRYADGEVSWPTSPRNTASAAPPSTASSTRLPRRSMTPARTRQQPQPPTQHQRRSNKSVENFPRTT